MTSLSTIILAAGKGTRMKSSLPKVLHKVAGKEMIFHVLEAVKKADSKKNIIIVGHEGEKVVEIVGEGAEFVWQKELLGTGHAVLQAEEAFLETRGAILVLCGDTPLVTENLLKNFFEEHKKSKAQATVLTATLLDATGYGRIVRDKEQRFLKIVEDKDATKEEKDIKEINAGIYLFDKRHLFHALKKLTNDNAQGEYYLTDVLEIMRNEGLKVEAFTAKNAEDILGVNSRVDLAKAEKILRRRKNISLMQEGVTIIDPDTTFIDIDVTIGKDSVIHPFTFIEGKTNIGEKSILGPYSRFVDVEIGEKVSLQFIYAHECKIEDNVSAGPYVHLRPNTVLKEGVKVGNFVEVKNSTIGKKSKLPHLSYIGDCDMGENVNMGCGTITVNYDGNRKHRTKILDNAFVGCNANLVAPVSIGKGAYVAAGSTITKDVTAGALAVAREKQKNINDWVRQHQLD